MPWRVDLGQDGNRHVVPDFGPAHELTAQCWCRPLPDKDAPWVIVHWSHEKVAQLFEGE